MQGSQIANLNPNFSGRDLGVPEVYRLGGCRFRKAVQTSDDWQNHDAAEIVFMLEGEACWEMGTHRLLQLNGGQVGVFPPGSNHRIMDGVYPPSRILWMLFLSEEPDGKGVFPPEEMAQIRQAVEHRETPVAMDENLVRNARFLADRLQVPGLLAGSRLPMAEVRAGIVSTLVSFWKACNEDIESRTRSEMVRETERMMREELADDLSIGMISKRLICSRSYLHMQFRRELGMSPVDYRQRLRVRRCCERLRESDDSISVIAKESGFANAQYLSRVFKKYMDTTPTEYRNKARAKEQPPANL